MSVYTWKGKKKTFVFADVFFLLPEKKKGGGTVNHNKPDVYLIPESFYYRSRAENLSKPAKLLLPLIL